MRDSVTAPGRARRTVRMAVALVLSQALLCGLIGWLTFGRSPASESRPGAQAVDPLVPPAVSTASTPSRESIGPAATGTATAATTATTAAARRLPPPSRTGTWPAPSRLPAAPPAPAEPPPAPLESTPAPTAPGGGVLPPAPSPSSAPLVQQPVTVGDHCHPEWGFGRTADGTLVRCLRSGPHRQRWKIV